MQKHACTMCAVISSETLRKIYNLKHVYSMHKAERGGGGGWGWELGRYGGWCRL